MPEWQLILRRDMKSSHFNDKYFTGKRFLRILPLLVLAVLLLWVNGCRKRENVQPVPVRQGWVSDYAKVLTPEEKERITSALESYEKETCHQIFLLIIPSLDGEKITDFSKRTATAWHIGQLGLGNGFLVSIAMKEGSVRIETGSAFEWFIQDGTAYTVLKEVIIPLFQQGKFVEGIERGLQEIMTAGRRNPIPENDKPPVCQ